MSNADTEVQIQQILNWSRKFYVPEEYPALATQTEQWHLSRPLAGRKILDGTPLFGNTLLKYVPLLAAGAELTVAISKNIPFDPQCVQLLKEWGIACEYQIESGLFDCILDCGGAHSHLIPRFGYVELTRSGAYHYQNPSRPVILVDDSRIKAIETCLGTGEGFLRGMQQLGLGDLTGKRVLIFGFGKVGCGVAYYARRSGAVVTVAELPEKPLPVQYERVDCRNSHAVSEAVRNCDCVVTCTGIAGALEHSGAAEVLRHGEQLIAAMGIENEWGNALPPERILNHNVPLNFILEEPTRLRYIDPTMALSNAGALELLRNPALPCQVQKIASAVEMQYWNIIEHSAMIADEIREAGL